MTNQTKKALLVWVTIDSADQAQQMARTLLEKKLCAGVNVLGGAQSMYWWKGQIEEQAEQVLMIQTHEGHFEELRKEIVKLHPYEVPEIIASEIVRGHAPYVDWIFTSTENT